MSLADRRFLFRRVQDGDWDVDADWVLVGEFAGLSDTDITALWERVGGRCRRVTIMAVAEPCIGHAATLVTVVPCIGGIVVSSVAAQRASYAAALCRARSIVAGAPACFTVEHLVLQSWSVAQRRVKQFDNVIVVDRPWGLSGRGMRLRALGGITDRAPSFDDDRLSSVGRPGGQDYAPEIVRRRLS